MSTRGIDIEKLKQLAAPHALRILESRDLEVVGSRKAAEVQIRNRSPKRVGGKGRGDERPSASWNSAKGLLKDFGDASFDGNLIQVVAYCDGVPFIDAAKRVADEAGVELPTLQQSGASRDFSRGAARGGDGADRENPFTDTDIERDKKIKTAQRKWGKGVSVLGSRSESYLTARGIVLSRDEPWVRSNDAAEYWAAPASKGDKPIKIATMPAMVGALTIAGVGESQAVVEIFFGHADNGEVTLKPRIVDQRSGNVLPNKPVRGNKAGAGVFVGPHLADDTIVVTEGLEDALSGVMAGFGAVAKLSSSDLGDLELPPNVKRVILAADNDDAGAKGIAKAAPRFEARGLDVQVAQMPGGIKDLNELLMASGVEAVRQALDEATQWRQAEDRSTVHSAADASASHDPGRTSHLIERADDIAIGNDTSQYLIKNLLDRRAVALLYGASAVGKSFVALRLASHVATGTDFGKHRVRKAPVLYAALEGEAGFKKRLAALHRQVGNHGNFLFRLCGQPVLSSGDDGDLGEKQILAAAQEIQAVAAEPVGLIVIDTLWRAMGGDDENDAAALSKLMARIARIQGETGAAILVVHHSGKDVARGPRGSSAIMPAVDLQMYLEMQGRERSLSVQKCKDGADGHTYPYRLDVVELGVDGDGDSLTSCVAHFDFAATEGAKNARKPPRSGSAAHKALEQLRELVAGGACIKSHKEEGIPEGVDLVTLEAWRAACERKRLSVDAAKKDSERKAFDRACNALETTGWVARTGGWVWLIHS